MLNTEQLIAEVLEIRSALIRGDYQSEVAISDYVVRRLFNGLGWPRYNAQVVFPQFPIKTRKVDFALCHPNGKPIVLIEVKAEDKADEQATQQLFEYCFHQGVPIAVLTDGRTWKLFYPAGEGSYKERLLLEMNLTDGDETEVANGLTRYLTYDAVKSGEARRRAQKDYEASRLQLKAMRKFPLVWNKLLHEPDSILLDLFEEAVATASGVRPDRQCVVKFLAEQAGRKNYTTGGTGSGPSPPPPPPTVNDPSHWFEFNGRKRTCKNAKEVLIGVFSELAKQDHTFCQRFRERIPGRRRNILAKIREDLYPRHPERIRAAAELPGGWWIDTHSNNAQKKDWIKAACDVAGIKFGSDIIVHIP